MLFDSHTHIHFSAYNKDREEVIKRARKAGVKMITVGINLDDSQRAVKLAEKYPDDIWATVGVHPNEIYSSSVILSERSELRDLIDEISRQARNNRVAAIGECGLDYFRGSENRESQKEIFIEQIKLAQELRKPLMIHCRPSEGTVDAYDDLIKQLAASEFQPLKIVHFFSGPLETAKQLLDLGCYFTFGGVITFTRAYDDIVKFVPLRRLMLETDAPYVAPAPHRGRRNEPAYVIEIAKRIAEIKNFSFKKITCQTTENVKQIFDIKVR